MTSKRTVQRTTVAVKTAGAWGVRRTEPATEHPHDGALLHHSQICQQSQLQASSHSKATDCCYQGLRQLQTGRTLEETTRLVHQNTQSHNLCGLEQSEINTEEIHIVNKAATQLTSTVRYIWSMSIWMLIFTIHFMLFFLPLWFLWFIYKKNVSVYQFISWFLSQTVKQKSNKWSKFWLSLNKWSTVYSGRDTVL